MVDAASENTEEAGCSTLFGEAEEAGAADLLDGLLGLKETD